MTSRSEFLARVRWGLGNPPVAIHGATLAPSHQLEADDRLLRLEHPGPGLADVFATRAVATGMNVHRCSPGNLAQTIQTLLSSLGANRIVLDHLDPLLARPVADALTRAGAEAIDPHSAKTLDPQFDSSAGIAGVLAAIAETGTLVQTSGAGRSRGTFLIPPIHIALVRESQIIPDMLDLWPLIDSLLPLPTAITLITGPSKTADIEGILVTGVHGPGAVHIVLIS